LAYFEGQDYAAIHLDVVEAHSPVGIINHAAFAFFDLDRTAAAVDAAGYPFKKAEIPGAGIVQFFVTGPEGVRIEIQCRGDDLAERLPSEVGR
jgi:catechol 2,3-dioxygenase-like lactoylglutathione lyase family enzyme